ncbi:putative E3 ubiquitin-protein ligase XBAT35 [Silene latifolia]|uniref:putative E3 ubiquitin-protein ligase XBAT35 n=1 Tax=Silene latifolia TaxID=37657 RepID=UPI003D7780BA
MGQKQSKDRLLYQYVVNGDIGGIQFLSKQGASLEWKDKQGKTPLIVAAKDPGLYDVAKTLIELGANVNAFCKGSHGGTPLHYAAKEGIERTVALLLLHGANAFVKNHENRTPLDVARKNGRNLVVREIEGRICYFSGYIRETFGPGFSDATSLQMSSRVIWVVVVPRSLHKPPKRPELELVIYSTPQDAEPRRIVLLRKSKIKEPRFDQPSPAMNILDKRTGIRYKFSPVSYSDKQQLRRLYNACKGISQVKPASAQMGVEPWDSSVQNSEPPRNSWDHTISSPTTWRTPTRPSPPMTPINNPWAQESPRIMKNIPGSWSAPHLSPLHTDIRHSETIVPSAPPLVPDTETVQISGKDVAGSSSSCVVCWEAPVEAACVPCGHVSSCLSCLQEIKSKNGVCPVCRAHIDQVMKLYGI